MEYGKDNDLKAYCAMFKDMSDNLKIRKLVSEIEHMKLFLKELPVQIRERAMRKTSMNSKKPETMKFNTMCAFMMKEA